MSGGPRKKEIKNGDGHDYFLVVFRGLSVELERKWTLLYHLGGLRPGKESKIVLTQYFPFSLPFLSKIILSILFSIPPRSPPPILQNS